MARIKGPKMVHRYSAEFKVQVVGECRQPGASVAEARLQLTL